MGVRHPEDPRAVGCHRDRSDAPAGISELGQGPIRRDGEEAGLVIGGPVDRPVGSRPGDRPQPPAGEGHLEVGELARRRGRAPPARSFADRVEDVAAHRVDPQGSEALLTRIVDLVDDFPGRGVVHGQHPAVGSSDSTSTDPATRVRPSPAMVIVGLPLSPANAAPVRDGPGAGLDLEQAITFVSVRRRSGCPGCPSRWRPKPTRSDP